MISPEWVLFAAIGPYAAAEHSLLSWGQAPWVLIRTLWSHHSEASDHYELFTGDLVLCSLGIFVDPRAKILI
ncbi:hypothetical protein Pdw03_6895 [Penicillium digitatum]|uniref:Uncharacterized protein n=1 Tax=Penicillium digitatum TaxID=36651 RepID=A0A7T7BKD5_PENDI|nr:hypothetical protein Pdw03_6895 [Penicillium digitatum]